MAGLMSSAHDDQRAPKHDAELVAELERQIDGLKAAGEQYALRGLGYALLRQAGEYVGTAQEGAYVRVDVTPAAPEVPAETWRLPASVLIQSARRAGMRQ